MALIEHRFLSYNNYITTDTCNHDIFSVRTEKVYLMVNRVVLWIQDGDTGFIMSVKEKHFETANVLLERGADVNARGKVCAARVNMRIYELYNDKRRYAAV